MQPTLDGSQIDGVEPGTYLCVHAEGDDRSKIFCVAANGYLKRFSRDLPPALEQAFRTAGAGDDVQGTGSLHLWAGDGVHKDPRSSFYRAVWTREHFPFHLWRCGMHVYDDPVDLVIRSRFHERRIPHSEILSIHGWIHGFETGGVSVRCWTKGMIRLLRLSFLLPFFDVTYNEWDRDRDYDWVNRLTIRIARHLRVPWTLDDGGGEVTDGR